MPIIIAIDYRIPPRNYHSLSSHRVRQGYLRSFQNVLLPNLHSSRIDPFARSTGIPTVRLHSCSCFPSDVKMSHVCGNKCRSTNNFCRKISYVARLLWMAVEKHQKRSLQARGRNDRARDATQSSMSSELNTRSELAEIIFVFSRRSPIIICF